MSEQQPLLTLDGSNGQLELYPNRLVLRKRGWIGIWGSSSSETQLEIKLKQVTAVNLFRPQPLLNGMLIITFVDEHEHRVFLVYARKHGEQALRMKEHIEDYLSRAEIYPFVKGKDYVPSN